MPKNFSFRVTNDTPQSERRAVLRNERAGTTYHEFAAGEADVPRGRFTAHERSVVTGSTPVPQYPALPTGAWSNQTVAIPPEPSLGFSVDALEPTGTPSEVERSIGETHSGDGGELPSAVADGALPGDARFAAGGVRPSVADAPSPPRRRPKRRIG